MAFFIFLNGFHPAIAMEFVASKYEPKHSITTSFL